MAQPSRPSGNRPSRTTPPARSSQGSRPAARSSRGTSGPSDRSRAGRAASGGSGRSRSEGRSPSSRRETKHPAARPRSADSARPAQRSRTERAASAKRPQRASRSTRSAAPSARPPRSSDRTAARAQAPSRGAGRGRVGAATASSRRASTPRRSRRAPVAIALAATFALVLGIVAVDGIMNGNRIYQGVSIGDVDVSGMTREEAGRAVEEAYGDQVASGRGIIFASEEARDTVDVDTELTEEAAQAEQLSVEEARADKKLWVAEAGTLGARVPVAELTEEAFSVGRAGGVAERIQAAAERRSVPVRVAFDEEALEALALEIDQTLGEPRQDCDVAVEDGHAQVVEGHDGTIVDRTELKTCLEEGFLSTGAQDFSFVAHVGYAPLRVSLEAAEQVRDLVQRALDRGITFTFEGISWNLGPAEIGPWISTEVQEDEGAARLVPFLDEKAACAELLRLIREAGFVSAATVRFEVDGGEVWVLAQDGSRYPLLAQAVAAADAALFGTFRDQGDGALAAERPVVAIDWGAAPARSTFDEALELGLISAISSFTTEYNDAPSTANRRHNIHLAADMLDNSIAPASGGIWSFTDITGDATEETGFKGAGAISNGEFVDAIGGGICQVATTVFNAVYEAGFPVTERRNHSLYISSYPTGRDAAIAYPYLDLKWENDSTSDVLLRTRYTDSSLTVTLYGIDPGYVVSSKTGEWREGEEYQTKTKVDENEPEGTRYVKTKGANGRSVTVCRTVRDRAGNLLHEDNFESNYAPVDEVVVTGPNTPAAEEKDDTDNTEETEEDKEDARVSTGD